MTRLLVTLALATLTALTAIGLTITTNLAPPNAQAHLVPASTAENAFYQHYQHMCGRGITIKCVDRGRMNVDCATTRPDGHERACTWTYWDFRPFDSRSCHATAILQHTTPIPGTYRDCRT